MSGRMIITAAVRIRMAGRAQGGGSHYDRKDNHEGNQAGTVMSGDPAPAIRSESPDACLTAFLLLRLPTFSLSHFFGFFRP